MKKNSIYLGQFTRDLMEWHETGNRRQMPWKGEKDPYRIWLSEIILQQTRVEQGMAYYLRFLKKYPNVQALASAADQEVFKLWEGLGYYSRCRNLLHTARTIIHQYNGVFPQSYEELLTLKGVGSYTASAIASFAYGLPYAVVDGNVLRVLARYFGVHLPVNEGSGKEKLSQLAQAQLDKKRPAAYNQAIMDFGATVCKPLQPHCSSCALSIGCKAFQKNMVGTLPIKTPKPPRKKRYFVYFILCNKGKIWVQERTDNDIWRHLSEFYLSEGKNMADLSTQKIKSFMSDQNWTISSMDIFPGTSRQLLTHQEILTTFVRVVLNKKPNLPKIGMWATKSELQQLAFPVTIHSFLEKNGWESLFQPT